MEVAVELEDGLEDLLLFLDGGEVDVELGKHWIDVLGMLEKKTAGNLTPQEKRMLESLLSDLRMQYVSLANSPQFGRKFTGSDITGGR